MKNNLIYCTILWLLVVVVAYWHPVAAADKFILRAPLEFGGFTSGMPIWVLGKGLRITAVDVSLAKRLAEMEGKNVIITIEVEP